jgi:quercetin dioxygenase-like cupin family protein
MRTKSAFFTQVFAFTRSGEKILGFGILYLFFAGWVPPSSAAEPGRVTNLMTKALDGIPGKEATMITVDYAPGGADPVHRHNAYAFVYVLEGTVIMQMEGGRKVTLHPGQTFYEDPHGIHLVGQNASNKKPAKFLVFLIKDKNAPIFVPVAKQTRH